MNRPQRLRRRLGVAIAAAGAVLLALPLGAWTRGALAADRARAEWEAAVTRAAIGQSRQLVDAAPLARPSDGAPIARLVIPAAELDAIVLEGVSDRTLMAGPGHLSESVLPGNPGNAIISAHRDRHFRNLGRVHVGDTLLTETLTSSIRWVVVERRIASAGTRVALRSATPLLTLSTCWPIGYLGSAPDRLILTARPL